MKLKTIILLLVIIILSNYVMASENLSINSNTAVVMDADSSIVLYNKNMDKKIYPASTT